MRYRTDLMESILTSEEAQKIIDFVTPIYGEAYVFLWLIQVVGAALDECITCTDQYFNQVTPQTATWAIEFWEDEYAIIPDYSWDLAQRRQNVMDRMRCKAPITPKKIKDSVSAAIGRETIIVENTGKNKFGVYINGYTTDTKKVIELINKAKPAHLIYDFVVSDYTEAESTVYNQIFVTANENIQINVE